MLVLAAVCVVQRVSGPRCAEPFAGFRDDRARDLSRPFVPSERVPFALLFPLVIVVAALAAAVRALVVFAKSDPSTRWAEAALVLASTALCTAQCFFGSIAASQGLKNRLCRLRPDYAARERIAAADSYAGTSTFFAAELLADGRVSFPSGHAALLAAVFLLLVLVAHRDAPVLCGRCSAAGRRALLLLYTAVLAATAAVVCHTRVSDNRHHPSDVVAGAAIGVLTAVATHARWKSTLHTLLPQQPPPEAATSSKSSKSD